MRKTRIIAVIAVVTLISACTPTASTTSSAPPAVSTPAAAAATGTTAPTAAPATAATGTAAPAAATGAAPTVTAAEHLTFTYMCNYGGTEPPKDEVMFNYFEEKMNTTIEMTWIPTNAYADKLAAQIAAADLPNVAVSRSPFAAVIVNAARSGMVWPMTPYITPEYPNFDRFNKNVLKNLTIDGTLYCLPRERESVRAGVFYRQDWLDKLGLEEPKSVEDIMEICRAFTEDDPDGNGQKDTVGMSFKGTSTRNNLTVMAVWLGGVKGWYVGDDGNIHNEVETPEYQQALDCIRELYANGYMVSDFALVTDELVPFKTGKAGVIVTQAVGDGPGTLTDLQSITPTAEVGATMEIYGPSGELTIQSHAGYTGSIIFPKTSTKTEEELIPILRFWDALGSPENALFMNQGIEGVHYTIEDGFIVSTPEQSTLRGTDFQDVSQFHPYGYETWFSPSVKQSTPLRQKISDSMKNLVGNTVQNPCEPLVSETATQLGTTLSDILNDGVMKYVLGEIDLAGWEKVVADWRAAGGDKVAAEYTELYKAAQANN